MARKMNKTAETDIRKWPVILTDKEVGECQRFSARIHWGFNEETLTKQIKRFEDGDTKEKCKVYYILEDCNFHEVAEMLAEGKIAEAYKWAKTL